eukprot:7987907-Ditylum_brightwellii.AAC.1
MKKQTDEIEAWRVNFDADQQLRNREQDKKMSLANSVQQQLTTHQSNTSQMMTAHREHIDALLKELAVAFNNITGNITANSNAISSITDMLNTFNNGPHNKRQKHGNAATADAYAMGNADALQVNRGAHAPDPGGVGVK